MSTPASPVAADVAVPTPARVSARIGAFARRYGPPLLVFVLFIGLWGLLATTVYGDRNYLLPRPWDVASEAWASRSELWAATKITFGEAAAGFGLAILVGMAVAVIMSQAKVLERSLYPYAVMLQTVPIVAVAPVIVLWFGYNQRSVIVIAFMIAVFPILNNTLLGLLSTDRDQVDLFRLHRAGRVKQFLKLRLPGATPSVFAGLRISAGLSVIGAKVIFAQGKLDTNLLFAEVFAATLLGFLFFVLVSYVGNLLLRSWHESALKAES